MAHWRRHWTLSHGGSQNLAEEENPGKNWNWVKYAGLLRLLRSDCTYPTNVIKRATLPISILDNSICGHIQIIPNGRK